MKLRILIIDMVVTEEWYLSSQSITWVSKFFVTQSLFAKGSGLLSKNVR